jgi:hypothetical protein
MNSKITIFALLLFASVPLFRQDVYAQKTCGFDIVHQANLRNNPAFEKRLEAFEQLWQEKQELMRNTAARVVVTGSDTAYEIPVVFHVIHTGSAIGTNFNPTDAKIQNTVAYLNQTYSATYSGYPAVGSGGVNIPIRFVLAKRDPSCVATTGITRTNGVTALGGTAGTNYDNNGVAVQTLNGVTDSLLKSIIQWDPANYYNIWVVNKIDGWSGYVAGSGVVGYAQFAGGPPRTDGTVIMEAFNDVGQTTLPHEFGHAFNLYHTFEGGCVAAANCATNGDRVCDTDPHDQVSGCPTGINICTGTSWLPVVYNIMNYTNCTDRFTAGQSLRAKTAILNQRGTLVQSLGGTDITTPPVVYTTPTPLVSCANPGIVNASNTNDMGPENIKVGSLVSYSNGYNGDGNQVYINHTVSTCLQPAVAPVTLLQGQTYPVEVSTGFNPENVRIWIDFNNNGSFAAGELVFTSNGVAADQYRIHTGNTTAIPSTGVTTGIPLRMRVISDFYGNSNPAACGGNLQYGQAEDFSVIISAPLAVHLLALNATANALTQSIAIHWESAVEADNLDRYEIESSQDAGKTFQMLGSEVAKGSNSKYDFNDANPLAGILNLYRLKMIDKSGKFEYSQVVSASLANKEQAFSVYPNPTEGILKLKVPQTGYYSIKISNAVGQEVFQLNNKLFHQGTEELFDFSSAKLASGVYYFKLTNEAGNLYMSKFLKK